MDTPRKSTAQMQRSREHCVKKRQISFFPAGPLRAFITLRCIVKSATRWQKRYSFPQIYLAKKPFLPRAYQRTSVVQEIITGEILGQEDFWWLYFRSIFSWRGWVDEQISKRVKEQKNKLFSPKEPVGVSVTEGNTGGRGTQRASETAPQMVLPICQPGQESLLHYQGT